MSNEKILYLSIFAAIFNLSCKSPGNKYFTGTIEYDYSYTSQLLNVDSLSASRQLKAYFRYDEENYQSRFINPDTVTYYYSGKLNKALSETNSLGNYECEDYSVITDSILSFQVYDTDEKVLGYSCRILEVQKENSRLVYYFSTEIKMAPATYNNHRSYNWDFYGKKSEGGIILKSEVRLKDFTKRGVAVNVNRKEKNFKALEINETFFSKYCN